MDVVQVVSYEICTKFIHEFNVLIVVSYQLSTRSNQMFDKMT
jgi:hypothetical protein